MADLAPPPSESTNVAPPSFGPCLPHLLFQAPLASDAISFYKRAFGAVEVSKSFHPKRKADQEQHLLLHAHLKFGSAEIMLCDESDATGPNVKSPASLKGTTTILHLVTDDVDAAYEQALEAGAKPLEEVTDQPLGTRCAKIVDPFGHVWSLTSPAKEVIAAVEDPVVDGE